MHTQLRTDYHQGIPHVVAGISHISKLNAFDSSQLFLDRKNICQHLCGVELIGKSVPHRNPCIFCKLLHDFLAVTTILNTFIHTSEDSRRVCNTLFLSDLGTARIQIGGAHPQVMGGNLEGAAGSGTGLFKDQRHIFAPVHILC